MIKRKQLLRLFISILLVSGGGLFSEIKAQDEDSGPVKQRRLPMALHIDGGLGNLVRPLAMKNNFYSVGDLNLGVFFGIYKGWNIGLNMRYTGFQIRQGAANVNDTIIDGLIYQVRTIHNMYTPGITLGYDRWVGDYTFFNFNINAGYSLIRYSKIRSAFKADPSTYNYNALLFEPAINLFYFFEDHVGMSIKLSYTRLQGNFRPETIGLGTGAISYTSAELKGNISYISFGLGFIYSFKRVE